MRSWWPCVWLVLAAGNGCAAEPRESQGGPGFTALQASSEALPERFDFGRPATEDEIRSVDIDVRPDGAGLPPGYGTAAQGTPIFAAKCALCHGVNGEGGPATALVGGGSGRTVGNYWPYATTIYDYINRSMPLQAPGSLVPTEIYSLVAWILTRNGIIGLEDEVNATTLPAVVMPARDRFVPDDRRIEETSGQGN